MRVVYCNTKRNLVLELSLLSRLQVRRAAQLPLLGRVPTLLIHIMLGIVASCVPGFWLAHKMDDVRSIQHIMMRIVVQAIDGGVRRVHVIEDALVGQLGFARLRHHARLPTRTVLVAAFVQ